MKTKKEHREFIVLLSNFGQHLWAPTGEKIEAFCGWSRVDENTPSFRFGRGTHVIEISAVKELKADMKKLEKALEKHVEKCGTGFRHKELLRKHKAKYGV